MKPSGKVILFTYLWQQCALAQMWGWEREQLGNHSLSLRASSGFTYFPSVITLVITSAELFAHLGTCSTQRKVSPANVFDVVVSLAITWRELFWLHDGWLLPSVQRLEVTAAVVGERVGVWGRGSRWFEESAGTDAWGQDPEKRAGTC